MLIVRDSQVKKLFYKEQEIDKILDWKGNVVFEKESAPTMTNTIKFHTNSSVSGHKYFTISYTDSTYNDIDYSEPNKLYTIPIPTDKTVRKLTFSSRYVDEVIVSCKIQLHSSFFDSNYNTIRLLSCDSTASTSLSNAFDYINSNAKLIEIRNLDARNATNMERFFYNSIGIESIVMRDLNVSKVTNMDSMFCGCSGAATIDIANWNSSSVTTMASMFNSCSSVKSLDLSSSINASNVTTMENMFYRCYNLKSVNMSGFETSKIANIDYMFSDCHNLESLDLSSFSTTNLTKLECVFYYCSSLTDLDISGWDLSNVTRIYDMFYYCKALKTIYMRGCNQTTIDKIKSALTDAGILNNVTIVTE